jgi:F-type H+-transporting ATPase subunit b
MSVLASILAAEGGAPTYESHHWLFPETKEIIWGGLAFLIIFGGLWKFALPQFKKAFAARTERIEKDLSAAANAKKSAEQSAARIREQLGDLDGERARLIAEAEAQAAQLLVDGRARLDAEAVELEAKATADITVGQGRLAGELQAEVAAIAAAATQRLVASELDDTTQRDLVEQFIARVGAAR